MIWITDAAYIKEYVLLISFSNGVKKSVDLQNELDEGVFIPLKDKTYFKRFHISANTVEWENGADFAPEFLYGLGTSPICEDGLSKNYKLL